MSIGKRAIKRRSGSVGGRTAKHKHVVEVCNFVDAGTSIALWAQAREDFREHTAMKTVITVLQTYGYTRLSGEHLPPLFFLKAWFIVALEAVPGTNNLPMRGSEHFYQQVEREACGCDT